MKKIISLATSLLAVVALTTMPAAGQYVAVSKLPPSYLDKTQQVDFHNRLVKEYGSYPSHPDERVRGWHDSMVGAKAQKKPHRLDEA